MRMPFKALHSKAGIRGRNALIATAAAGLLIAGTVTATSPAHANIGSTSCGWVNKVKLCVFQSTRLLSVAVDSLPLINGQRATNVQYDKYDDNGNFAGKSQCISVAPGWSSEFSTRNPDLITSQVGYQVISFHNKNTCASTTDLFDVAFVTWDVTGDYWWLTRDFLALPNNPGVNRSGTGVPHHWGKGQRCPLRHAKCRF